MTPEHSDDIHPDQDPGHSPLPRRSDRKRTEDRTGGGTPATRAVGPGPKRVARRRSPLAVAAAWGVLVALLALLGLGVFLGVRALSGTARARAVPSVAAALISVEPTDALVAFGDRKPQAGLLSTGSLQPGQYAVRVSRKGFEALAATVTCSAGATVTATYRLKPLPVQVSLSGHPTGSTYAIASAYGKPLAGKLPFKGSLPAGPTTLTVSSAGYAPVTRAIFVDQPAKLDLWLDPPGQVVRTMSVFGCGNSPKGVALTPDGKQAWVTLLDGTPAVEIYDPKTGGKLGTVTLGKNGAVEVIFNRAGTRAYVSQMETARVYEIDVRTRRVLRTLETKSSWTKVVSLSPDEDYLYAANWTDNDVSRFDLKTGKLVSTFPTVNTPRGLYPTPDGKYLYVAGFGKGDIAKIDLFTKKSKKIFSNQGSAMRHLVGDPKTGIVYVSDMGKACVWKLDIKTDKVTFWAKVDSHPNTIDLSPDGKVLFVSNRGVNNPKTYYIPGPEWGTILLLDTSTGKPLDCIVGGNQCTALDVSEDGRTLMFSDFLDNRMHVYSVPAFDTLLAGKGGRYSASRSELKKKGWGSASSGSSSGSGSSD